MASSNLNALNTALDVSPLRPLHWRIWGLSAMGVFIDGFDLFIIGVALPLVINQYKPGNVLIGLTVAAASLGALVGALFGGMITDRVGRKPIYVLDMLLVIIFCLGSACAWNMWSLAAMRFLLGLGIGADYPLCASYISEFIPARLRGRMIIAAFSFQAFGMLAAAAVGALVLKLDPSMGDWRWMLGLPAAPAFVVLILRMGLPESARWYLEHGQFKKAAQVVGLIVPEQKPQLVSLMEKEAQHIVEVEEKKLGYADLFSKKFRRRTLLATVPWFLMDISTYGIGIFTPLILTTFLASHAGVDGAATGAIASDFRATEGAAFVDLFLILGFVLNICLVDHYGRIRLQIIGFAGMAAGLVLLSLAGARLEAQQTPSMILVFLGFILFNVMMNLGPNATTFILPAELFPTRIRASGHGLAAGCAKLGATVGLFLLPIFKGRFGLVATLVGLTLVSLAALIVTVATRIETAGRSLEDLHPGEAQVD